LLAAMEGGLVPQPVQLHPGASIGSERRHSMPYPFLKSKSRSQSRTSGSGGFVPPVRSWPWVGAQVASPRCPILRPGFVSVLDMHCLLRLLSSPPQSMVRACRPTLLIRTRWRLSRSCRPKDLRAPLDSDGSVARAGEVTLCGAGLPDTHRLSNLATTMTGSA
jgi:hypothetical protein